MTPWPTTEAELAAVQRDLGAATPQPWQPQQEWSAAGCFICFGRDKRGAGAAGDPAWAAAAVTRGDALIAVTVVRGAAGAAYVPGLLALREGALLEDAVQRLPQHPDLLIVDATGRDHPRRAGLALHLGARQDLPSIGVTNRPLLAQGEWPPDEDGAMSPLILDGEVVGYWLRPHRGVNPLAIHAGWRTSPDVAAAIALALCRRSRTPEPLRRARQAAREARSQDER